MTQGGNVTLKGEPVMLVGSPIEVGQEAPDFIVVDEDFSPVRLSSFRGKPCILCSVVSLDTDVCDAETRRFNEEAGRLGQDVQILVISMDLPFAQKRWCGAARVRRVKTLSDYRDASFGSAYGVLIKELHLLARAVFVIDAEGRIRYKELVKEITDEPDYEKALAALRQLV